MCMQWLIFILASVGIVSPREIRSCKPLINYLGLENNDVQLKSLPPVDNWRNTVTVFSDLFLTSITQVNEKAQSISSQITLAYGWTSNFTIWNPDDFNGMQTCIIKKDMVWTPEIIIAESIKMDYATLENSFVKLIYGGIVATTDILTVTTACKMDLFQFPFDTQTCAFTLQSPIFSTTELKVRPLSDESFLTLTSQKAFQTQGEWELLSINVSQSNISALGGEILDQLIYMITIKRKPVLYIIDFLMPVFYCLILDLASFFVDSNLGKKLSFKVTLLLAISVLLRMLKDMLPSTTNEIPLIGVYCIVIFTVIGISILETILVSFLQSKANESDLAAAMKSISNLTDNAKNSSDSNKEGSQAPGLQKNCLNLNKVARAVDLIFFLLYLITISLFLFFLSNAWFS